jgi:hypothetical protein
MYAVVLVLALALTPAERALAYLQNEVSKWRNENGCFSCHNNGDGARALHAAGRSDAATTEWLRHPDRWDSNRGDPAVSDKKLARIQFAYALLSIVPRSQAEICQAAQVLVQDQAANGSWVIDSSNSPATYGTPLATYAALQVLNACDAPAHAQQRALAVRYLNEMRYASVAEAAAKLLHNPRDGGWGEQPGTPAQVYDTALVMLALLRADARAPAARGRALLIKLQQPGGGWPETTRPAGSQSYAQHISTTAWATLALLAADAK